MDAEQRRLSIPFLHINYTEKALTDSERTCASAGDFAQYNRVVAKPKQCVLPPYFCRIGLLVHHMLSLATSGSHYTQRSKIVFVSIQRQYEMVVIGIACLAGSTMPCENNNVGRPSNDATYKYGRKSISQ